MKRYSYRISNLDCANCAKTLEDGLNKNSNLKNVIINFTKQTISFDANDITIKELNKMVNSSSWRLTKPLRDIKRNL